MTFLDAVKAFEDDLKAKVNIPVHNKNIPTDSVSMRVALNNTNADGLFLNSDARVMTGQFNVEISAQLGTNKYDMMSYANAVLAVFVRGYSVQALDRRVLILQSNESTPYPTEAHQKINVIIDFHITKFFEAQVGRWQYNFDGIDDYMLLEQPFVLSDTEDWRISMDIRVESITSFAFVLAGYRINSPASRLIIAVQPSGQLRYNDVDNGQVRTTTFTIPFGADITVTLAREGSDLTMSDSTGNSEVFSVVPTVNRFDVFGQNQGIAFANGVIKNIDVEHSEPTTQYPNVFWPVDDGPGATIIRQTLPATSNWDATPVNFNDERWERV